VDNYNRLLEAISPMFRPTYPQIFEQK